MVKVKRPNSKIRISRTQPSAPLYQMRPQTMPYPPPPPAYQQPMYFPQQLPYYIPPGFDIVKKERKPKIPQLTEEDTGKVLKAVEAHLNMTEKIQALGEKLAQPNPLDGFLNSGFGQALGVGVGNLIPMIYEDGKERMKEMREKRRKEKGRSKVIDVNARDVTSQQSLPNQSNLETVVQLDENDRKMLENFSADIKNTVNNLNNELSDIKKELDELKTKDETEKAQKEVIKKSNVNEIDQANCYNCKKRIPAYYKACPHCGVSFIAKKEDKLSHKDALMINTRVELNEIAKELNLIPGDYNNKDKIINAILEHTKEETK